MEETLLCMNLSKFDGSFQAGAEEISTSEIGAQCGQSARMLALHASPSSEIQLSLFCELKCLSNGRWNDEFFPFLRGKNIRWHVSGYAADLC